MEPLLTPNPRRFVMFPVKHPVVWDYYKKAVSSFWTVEEINLTEDVKDWVKLNDGEKHFIKHVLAFFAASDGLVNENLIQNFCNEVQDSSVRAFYGFQTAIENIHSEMYSILIDTYVRDPVEKDSLFDALETMPCVAAKARWAFKYMNPKNADFAERVVAFACVEGIFFSGSFCAIFWLKKRGLMPGLCASNELISRDEALHCYFACHLYSTLVNKLPQERVHTIVAEAVVAETAFITEALPVSLIGMNAEAMVQYVHFVADLWLVNLGYAKLFNAKNPFEWMDLISMDGKANFFERFNGSYAKARVGQATTVLERVDDF